jgi:hypothetical protein
MAEQQAPASTEQTAQPAETTEQSSPMEQVYKDFNIEETAAQFQPEQKPATQQTQQPFVPKAPDPFDPGFQNFIQHTAQSVSALTQTLHATKGELTAMQQQIVRERTEVDISRAAEMIAKEADIDPEVAQVTMEVKARNDPRFLSIWNNRSKNPKAYNAALKALAQEASQKYAVRRDPQLVENQRAVKASQQQMATTTKESPNDKWAAMDPVTRQREIRKLITSGG